MGKKIFYAHAGSGNHGCEAIVRASVGLLGNDVVLYSMRPEEDYCYGLHKIMASIEHDKDNKMKKYSIPWFVSRIQTKLTGSVDWGVYNQKKAMIDAAKSGDIAFSIGGDNYCYPGTEILGAQNKLFRKKGTKTVLWGCSVEPELTKNATVVKDLASYNLIVARESISFNALKTVNPNTVLIPDPAFTLKRLDEPLPAGWVEGNMIGINASPMILQNAKDGGLVLDAYKELIQSILNTTDCSVALIPHVVWESNDDRVPLRVLYDTFKGTGRVILVEDHNCMELKGYIARCRFFFGARTHATIAAYSSCVPTLALGYSVKARGIARDLFGIEDRYVIPVQGLKTVNDLKNAFMWIIENEHNIQGELKEKIPTYIEQVFRTRQYIDNIL